jgi:molecular chaperone DnaK (HSP70)
MRAAIVSCQLTRPTISCKSTTTVVATASGIVMLSAPLNLWNLPTSHNLDYELADLCSLQSTNLVWRLGGVRFDLSEVDFESLVTQFDEGKKNTAAQRLRSSMEAKIQQFVRLNPTRIDYAEKLQEMLDRQNEGSANIEEFFEQLKLFAQKLTKEEKRAVSESLTEEELAMVDLLTKPEPKLTKSQEGEVKKVVKDLIGKLHNELLVLDWKKRQQTRAARSFPPQDRASFRSGPR